MAWTDTLYDASFRGVVFEYIGVDDSRDKTLTTHQTPFADDAIIHDMGNNPTNISMTAIIDGDDYETHLNELLSALEMQGIGELVHPVFGSQDVQVMSWSIKHDSGLVDGCMVEMQFVVAKTKRHIKPRFVAETLPHADQQADMIILSQPASELQTYQNQLATMSNDEAVALSRNIPEEIRGKLREVRTTLDTNLVRMDNLLSPPVWLGSIVSDVDGIVKLLPLDYDPMANWRRLFNRIKSLGDVFDKSEVLPLKRVGTVLPAVMMCRGALSVLDNELSNPNLTPVDLVAITDEVRIVCQVAIDTLRNDTAPAVNPNLPPVNDDMTGIIADIKTAAAQVQMITDRVINQRPPLISYTVQSVTTLRLLAHKLYADTNRTDELARLNRGLVNPAIIDPGTRLSVYAK